MEKAVCPLMSKSEAKAPCLKTDCALWHGDLERCSLALIAEKLALIDNKLIRMRW